MISISNSCRSTENEKSEESIWDLNHEMLLTSSRMLKSRDRFVNQTDVILEDFQESKMIQILIWDCQYWRFCRRIDWFPDPIIEIISVTREKDRFVIVNRYNFGLDLEQEEWFQSRCNEKKFHWYDDSKRDF